MDSKNGPQRMHQGKYTLQYQADKYDIKLEKKIDGFAGRDFIAQIAFAIGIGFVGRYAFHEKLIHEVGNDIGRYGRDIQDWPEMASNLSVNRTNSDKTDLATQITGFYQYF